MRTRDTVYVTAPSHMQQVLAPLVAGLLEEIRDATYRLARSADRRSQAVAPVLWALDEVANIAPLKKLPGIVSEGGGQGLQVVVCLQDLTQAKTRWGQAADGFLSLFGTKVVFPGIGDRTTLEALSMMVGDWDRPYTTYTSNVGRTVNHRPDSGSSGSSGEGWTYSTQREARVTPSEVSNIPPGHALLVRSGQWSLIETTPYYSRQPWQAALEKAPSQIHSGATPDTLPLHRDNDPAVPPDADRPPSST